MTSELGYDDLYALAEQLQLAMPADELHGSLSGYLAAGGRAGVGAAWLEALQLEPGGELTEAAQQALEQWRRQVDVALDDPELGFDILLPPDDQPLSVRADALAGWCRGFLGGFGLGGVKEHAKLSVEAKEYLRDIAVIAASAFEEEGGEEGEEALTQVQEFVRIGALLLHAEVVGATRAISGSLH